MKATSLLLLWWGWGGDIAAAGFDFKVVAIDFDLQAMKGAVGLHVVERHFEQVDVFGSLRELLKAAGEVVAVVKKWAAASVCQLGHHIFRKIHRLAVIK